jgi:hypothetical protein
VTASYTGEVLAPLLGIKRGGRRPVARSKPKGTTPRSSGRKTAAAARA